MVGWQRPAEDRLGPPGGRQRVVGAADLEQHLGRVGQHRTDARMIGADQREVDRLVREEGLNDIPPFDHPDVIARQGTIALELLEDRPDLAAIVVPLSGGGLISGIALAAKALKPGIRIIGVSMDRGAAMHDSLGAGKPVDVTEVASLAGGIDAWSQLIDPSLPRY